MENKDIVKLLIKTKELLRVLPMYGICYCLVRAYVSFPFPLRFPKAIKDLIGLDRYRPEGKIDDSYWWQIEDRKTRIDIIDKLIKEFSDEKSSN